MFALMGSRHPGIVLAHAPPSTPPEVLAAPGTPSALCLPCRPFAGGPEAVPAQWLQHVVSFITAQVPGGEVLPLLIVGLVSHNLRDPLTSVTYDDATTAQRCPMAHVGMSSSGMDHFLQEP